MILSFLQIFIKGVNFGPHCLLTPGGELERGKGSQAGRKADSLYRNYLVVQTQFHHLSGWRSRIWRSWAGVFTRGLRLWGWFYILPNSLKWPLEAAYGREINIKFFGNSSGGHSCSEQADSMLNQNLALCDPTAYFSGLLLSQAQGAPV